MAAFARFELTPTESKSVVLPLDEKAKKVGGLYGSRTRPFAVTGQYPSR